MSRSDRDHRYNTSDKGKERRRRYDRKLDVRLTRRERDLRRMRTALNKELDSVREELNWQTNMLSCGRVRSMWR